MKSSEMIKEIRSYLNLSQRGLADVLGVSFATVNRSKGIAMADEICRKYRCDGRFFDEILKAGE